MFSSIRGSLPSFVYFLRVLDFRDCCAPDFFGAAFFADGLDFFAARFAAGARRLGRGSVAALSRAADSSATRIGLLT
jgi:hypothetical protein